VNKKALSARMAKIQTPQPIRGTQDIFGADYDKFEHVVDAFHRIRKLYGFKGVAMPVIEPTAVFARSLGETTDVVSKEMYSFDDRGGDSVTLRPEFTAGLCRAYITNGWQQHAPLKVATHGPLFRYERPQKGRYRQFHQIDAEILGAAEPQADVELLVMADQLLKELGISEHITLHLNTLGDGPSRDAWRAALVEHFEAHRGELSEDSIERLAKNPLRILDSKDPRDRPIADSAPDIDAYLTDEARDYFDAVKAGLKAAGVDFIRNSRLVRGMDYYRHTAFEFITDQLGAQGTVLGGGRYDGLIGDMGGPETPAVGWAAGVERLAMLVGESVPTNFTISVVPNSPAVENDAIRIAQLLRNAGLRTVTAYKGNLKKRSEALKRLGVDATFIVRSTDDPMGRLHISHFSGGHSLNKQDKIENLIKSALFPEFGNNLSSSGWIVK
jgi:histidyl-tRNA synthetase